MSALDVHGALDVIDRLTTETAEQANRAAARLGPQFDEIGAGAGVGIRLRALHDARKAIVAAALVAHEDRS